MWKKIKSIVDKYIYWQINKRTSSCYMRSAIIVTTTGEEKILFSNTATTECWYKLIPLSNLVIAILGKLSFALSYIFLCFMLGFWFMASKLFLKIINHIKERYFPQKWFDIDTDSLSINFECSRKYRPPFVQLFSIVFFSTTFSFLFLIQCAVHYIFHYLDFLRDFCSLSESMGWVDYMRIALVVFQNIERATYALETQFKLNTKCQVPNTNWQKSSIFWGGVEST